MNRTLLTPYLRFIVLLVLAAASSALPAQNIVTIGTGTATNSVNGYPAPYGNFYWGAKHQMIVRASELSAQGMIAGYITSIAFNVAVPQGTPLTDFTIRMALTTNNSLTNTFLNPGFTTVWGPQAFTETSGWNTHTLSTPFYWDGTSNLVVETCFNNSSWTGNAQMYHSSTSYNSVTYYRQDAPNICSQTSGNTSQQRPNMRFAYTPATIPPTAYFTLAANACSGTVSFTDSSCCFVNGWLWDFGDGNTSTQQNPTHSYSVSGTYNVTLIVTNPYGSDTMVMNNAVTVTVGSGPVAPSCAPATLNYCCGFGITNVTLGSVINNSSGDGSEGYRDYSCMPGTVLAGQYYNISVSTPQPDAHNVRVWLDMNNDGSFNSSNELIFSANSTYLATGTVFIPPGTVLNTPLRMRVSADHDLAPIPGPCTDVQLGQVEDYGLIVQPNYNPPVSNFTADANTTCSGTVNFTDLSQNMPTTWLWDFGDGNTSTQQSPSHTYASNGVYTVTLITSNIYGSDTLVITNYINVAVGIVPVAASCTPQTFSYCCGYGIYNVTFHTSINQTSADGSEGYMDFTCSQRDTVMEGQIYSISVQTSPTDPQDTRVWMDFNNDGTYNQSNELVFTSLNTMNPSGTITIPAGTVLNTPLRMRVTSDYSGSNPGPCTQPVYGQTEDYTITIVPTGLPPAADFTSTETTSCGDGVVGFNDQSLNVPTSWLWDFGDGNTSILQNPTHTYLLPGTYTVQLTATNGFGSDVVIKNNLITVVLDTNLCDTAYASVPMSGNAPVQTACTGVIYDSGGPSNDYYDNSTGTVTISPVNTTNVTLTFTMFNFENMFDFVYVYDGPSTSSPLIGSYSGNSLPNGGTIVSSGPSITIQEVTDGVFTLPGFRAVWQCNPVGIENTSAGHELLDVYPNPSTGAFTVKYSSNEKKDLELVVYSAIGAEVLREGLSFTGEFERSVDLSAQPKGVYFLKVTGGTKQVVRKITIQ